MNEYDYVLDFQKNALDILERMTSCFAEPLLYRDEEWFKEDLERTSFQLSRQEFIDSFMEASAEYGLNCITEDELSKLYTYLRGGIPYERYVPRAPYPERGVEWPETIRWSKEIGTKEEEDYRKAIESLSPESTIRLYHGTDLKTAIKFLKSGIDLDVPPRQEQFPELYLTETGYIRVRRPGLYTSPSIGISRGFGRVVIEFDVLAKHLEPPRVETIPEPDPWRTVYPNSFYPTLSSYLLLSSGGEVQAFLKKSLDPEEILAVTYEGVTYSPEEFLIKYQ